MALIDNNGLPTLETFVKMQDPNNKIAANIVDGLASEKPVVG